MTGHKLLAVGAAILIVAGLAVWLGNKLARPPQFEPSLDMPLLMWDAENPYTVRSLTDGGCLIAGRTGSGKTSSSGRALSVSILALPHFGLNSTMVALLPKPDDLPEWLKIAERLGRPVRVFGPGHPLRFDFLDHLHRSGAATREIVKALTTLGETLRASDAKAGENSDFWETSQFRMLYNAVLPCRLATGRVDPQDIQRFISDRACKSLNDPKEKESYLRGFNYEILTRAEKADMTPQENKDFILAKVYWLNEIPSSDERTVGNTISGVMNILFTLCSGMVSELLATQTNFSLMERGWLTLVDASPTTYGESGYLLNAAIKFAWQWEILRRTWDLSMGIDVLWGDEAPNWITNFDSQVLAQIRSRGAAQIYLMQSLPGAYERLGGSHRAQMSIDSLCANFSTKIFHPLGDLQTAGWAAGLCGQHYATYVGGSVRPSQGLGDDLFGYGRFSGNFSKHLEHVVRPDQLLHGRTGGPENDFMCDALVVKSGMPFASGLNFLFTGFSQRDS